MKKLEEEGVGMFKSEGGDRAFFKLLPEEGNKTLVENFVNFTEYETNFKAAVGKQLTQPQQKRLLGRSPDKDTLERQYGYK